MNKSFSIRRKQKENMKGKKERFRVWIIIIKSIQDVKQRERLVEYRPKYSKRFGIYVYWKIKADASLSSYEKYELIEKRRSSRQFNIKWVWGDKIWI